MAEEFKKCYNVRMRGGESSSKIFFSILMEGQAAGEPVAPKQSLTAEQLVELLRSKQRMQLQRKLVGYVASQLVGEAEGLESPYLKPEDAFLDVCAGLISGPFAEWYTDDKKAHFENLFAMSDEDLFQEVFGINDAMAFIQSQNVPAGIRMDFHRRVNGQLNIGKSDVN